MRISKICKENSFTSILIFCIKDLPLCKRFSQRRGTFKGATTVERLDIWPAMQACDTGRFSGDRHLDFI